MNRLDAIASAFIRRVWIFTLKGERCKKKKKNSSAFLSGLVNLNVVILAVRSPSCGPDSQRWQKYSHSGLKEKVWEKILREK